jgi:hypothetical protein
VDWLSAAGGRSLGATLADGEACCGWAHDGIVRWCWVEGGGVGMRGKVRRGERCLLLVGRFEVWLDRRGKKGICGDGELCAVVAA